MFRETMTTLALDFGLKCGWAVGTADRLPFESGVWRLHEGNLRERGGRWLKLWRHLKNVDALYGPIKVIVFEAVRRHEGISAAHVYGGLRAIAELFAESRGERFIEVRTVEVAHVKQYATGKGNARKEKMLSVARQRFAFEIIDDNQADALWILAATVAPKADPQKQLFTKG